MNTKLICRLAKEAGIVDLDLAVVAETDLATFAALVAETVVEHLIESGYIGMGYAGDARDSIRKMFK